MIMKRVDCMQFLAGVVRPTLPDAHSEIITCMNMSLNGVYLRRYIWWMMRWIYPRLYHFVLMNKLQRTQRVVVNSP